MIVFIVLILSGVYASSENAVGWEELQEQQEQAQVEGTKENPYIINITGSTGGNQTFHYTSYPFYFKTQTIGSFEVSVDVEKQEVTFRLVDNQKDKIIALIKESDATKVDSKQLGIEYREAEETLISAPLYDIQEIVLGTQNNVTQEVRKTKLINMAPSASLLATRSNLYFFTNYEDNLVQQQINTLKSDESNRIGTFFNNSNATSLDYTMASTPVITDLIYEFNGVNNTALNKEAADENSIEGIVTRLFVAIGDTFLLKSMRSLFGNNISINTLIFNQFEMTRLDLYNESATGINASLRSAVTKWYNVFLTVTYIMYIVLLVYTGIMVITTAGTPRQERAKSFVTNWVVGLVLLILLPHYGFPLLFKLNDALVAYIGKDAASMDTYYTVLERHTEINGGDSMTEAIEQLEIKHRLVLEQAEGIQSNINTEIETIEDLVIANFENRIRNQYVNEPARAEEIINTGGERRRSDLSRWLRTSYETYENQRKFYEVNYPEENAHDRASSNIRRLTLGDDENIGFGLTADLGSYLSEDDVIQSILEKYKELYEKNMEASQIEQDIITLQNDVLGLMRTYAGKYNRLVFGVLFLMLLFQLIGLLVLYIKRMLMIAILIAIFPLIMLFYCIDKMADNTAQTLSLWFKEFLANIFIQSIHAVIYRVLVEMGLEVFQRDNGNWLLLVTAMMLILPAESIMKSVFGLNGMSLGQIGGMLEKATIGLGAIWGLATAGKRGNDKAVTSKEKKYVKNMQRKQTRADNRQATRDYKRAANNVRPDGFVKSVKNAAYSVGDWAHNRGNNFRKNMVKIHNFKNKAGTFTRVARNAGSIAIGAAYGLAGGDVNSMVQGAALARTLSGKQGKDKDYVKKQKEAKEKEKLKKRVGSAYKRKKP